VRREILVNATPPETRVALLEDGRTVEVYHERRGRQGFVGNIYKGRVHRVLPGMQAAFVAIGLDRDAFLYVEDAVPRPADTDPEESGDDTLVARRSGRVPRVRIDDVVKEGQELVVQITKDPLSGKGPRVTTNVALPGRTLVHLPSLKGIGISRKITEAAERDRLRAMLESLSSEGGFIARTAAQGASPAQVEADRAYLTDLAARLTRKAENAAAPSLLHREAELALRAVRDLASGDVDAIRVDDEAAALRLTEFLRALSPALALRVEVHRRSEPLFTFFGVEAEIEAALKSRVPLPSGGSIVIHQTEALVAIDVNTGRYVGKEDLEETVFAANLEAVPELARQIRLRDLGGLLVVDFIDMEDPGHRQAVFESFEAELVKDRSRTRVLQISDFGLVEITRQRSRGNLERVLTRACPECGGGGRVKTDLTAALDLRRALLSPGSLFTPGETVRLRVHPGLSQLLREDEPDLVSEIEAALQVRIELVEDGTLTSGGYVVEEG
jgi:ribonuclease G